MADKEEAPPEKKSWWKAVLGTMGGLLSGIVVMYLTPWVDKVVKPAKPIANFSVDYSGATVRFHNLSLTKNDGWWEFGDGSPLVPVSTDTEFVTHTYLRPGDYTAKMTLRNPLGDENERTVTVHVEGATAATKPQVVALEAIPLSAGSYAPATFKLVCKVANAEKCVWDFGDDRPFEVTADAKPEQERLVTFTQPGGYVVKLAAINGTTVDERTEIVTVQESPRGSLSLVVNVTDDALRVEKDEQLVNIGATFPSDNADASYAFERQFMAHQGYTIADIHIPSLLPNGPETLLGNRTWMALDAAALGVRSTQKLQVQLADDRRSGKVTGELVRPPAENGKIGHAALHLPALLVIQRQVPAHRDSPVTTTLTLPAIR